MLGDQQTSNRSFRHCPVFGEVLTISRRGNCHDKAVAESFFNLLKRERIRRRTYTTRVEVRQDVFDYIEMFYNPKRKHVRNGMPSPIEFERQQEMRTESVKKTRGYSYFHLQL